MNLSEVAACLCCETRSPAIQICGAAIDSRKTRPGNIFFCLQGERVDGHNFARDAVENGAVCVVATRPLPDLPVPVLLVEDAVLALGRLARFWRGRMRGKVICITGTAGKTTLKEMLAPILAHDGKCASTAGNFNNQIGMPLTILNTDGDEKYWLLEAGISHNGDMEYLGEICRPDLALILNVGEGHTAGLGVRGVAWNKTRILKYLAPQGRALINADYPELAAEARKTGADLRFFGNETPCVEYGPCAETSAGYSLRIKGVAMAYKASAVAPAMTETLLAAVSIACELGIGNEQIRAGLMQDSSPGHRFQLLETASFVIIDDSYNANPLSMRRSLTAAAREAQRRQLPLIAVLGEMGELGEAAMAAHGRLGRLLGQLQPAAVFWKGDWQEQISAGYPGPIYTLGAPGEFPQLLASAGMPAQALLIFKGSRLNHLDEYIESLLASPVCVRRDDVL